jgi:flagellar FliL protein
MPAPRSEPAPGGEEKRPREARPEAAEAKASPEAAPKPESGGWWQAWLPLIVSMVAMPLLAYGVTTFVLAPRLQKSLHGETHASAPSSSSEGSSAHEGAATSSGQRESVALNKVLVNVAGTMGSRYLLASIAVMGTGSNFKDRITDKEPQLRDVASSILMTKTIADLEKPGARNLIRGELLAGFNNVLGEPGIQEIYFTEFAIQ